MYSCCQSTVQSAQRTPSCVRLVSSYGLVCLSWIPRWTFESQRVLFHFYRNADDLKETRGKGEKWTDLQQTVMSVSRGRTGAVAPADTLLWTLACWVPVSSNPVWMPSGRAACWAEPQERRRSAGLRSTSGSSSRRCTDSYQGDLPVSPLFQVNSPESALGVWIELVQNREKTRKKNGFKRQFTC